MSNIASDSASVIGQSYSLASLDHRPVFQYAKEGWMGRKAVALFKAAWHGVILTIYNVVRAIIGDSKGNMRC